MKKYIILGIFVLIILGVFLISRDKEPEVSVEDKIALALRTSESEKEYIDLLSHIEGMNEETLKNTLEKVEEKVKAASSNNVYFAHAVFYDLLYKENRISQADAKAIAASSLERLPLSAVTSEYEVKAFESMLSYIDKDLADQLIKAVIDRYGLNQYLTAFLGSYCIRAFDESEIVKVYENVHEKQIFLDAVFLEAGMEGVSKIASGFADDDSRKKFIVSAASGYQKADDVLAFIHMADKYGVKPSECYPKGKKIDIDLMHLNSKEASDRWVHDGKMLVVSRTEQKEKLEYKVVPPEEYSLESDFTSTLYDDFYESNQSLGMEAFEVVLDTNAMDNMPKEMIPLSVSEVGLILVFDTQYVRCSILRNTEYEMPTYNSTGITIEKITSQRHYPTYDVMQCVDLFNFKSGLLEYTFEFKFIEPPKDVKEGEVVNNSFVDNSTVLYMYSAVPDEAWMEDAYEKTISIFESVNWDIEKAKIRHYNRKNNIDI